MNSFLIPLLRGGDFRNGTESAGESVQILKRSEHMKGDIMLRSSALILAFCLCVPSPAKADLLISFSDSGSGVDVSITGSLITTDGFAAPISSTFGGNPILWLGAVSGHNWYGFESGTVDCIEFQHADFDFFVPFGTAPATSHSINETGFEMGFRDAVSGASVDTLYMPVGYSSGDVLNEQFTNIATDFAAIGLTNGDSFGFRFDDGVNGIQSVTFSAIPEPSSTFVLLGIGVALFCTRRRQLIVRRLS